MNQKRRLYRGQVSESLSTDKSPAGRSNKVRAEQSAKRQFPPIGTSQSEDRGKMETCPGSFSPTSTLQCLILICIWTCQGEKVNVF